MNKNLFKKLSALLALIMVMALPVVSFADWTTYGGNNNHNAVVEEAPFAAERLGLSQEIELRPDIEDGWDGVDNVPVMRTVDGNTYAYVFHDGLRVEGDKGGGRVAKINCETRKIVWNIQVEPVEGFQLSTPLLVPGENEADDVLYVGSSKASQMLPALNSGSWTVTGGQMQDGKVEISDGNTASLTNSGFFLNRNASRRVALGIYLGTEPVEASATVTWNVNGVTGSKTFSSEDIFKEEYAPEDAGYYFYLNENIPPVNSQSTNRITYTVKVTGAPSKVVYAKLYDHVGSIQKLTHLDATGKTDLPNCQTVGGLMGLTGQINTPITTDGKYLYFGTWRDDSSPGKYYQMKLSDNTVQTFTPNSHGFYWAGAVTDGERVYFGSDNGKLYWRKISSFATVGDEIDLKTAPKGASDAGNVRSTIMKEGDGDGMRLYFTSQGGYLWCCKFDSGLKVDWKKKIADGEGVKSTSTPTKTGNRIYVGYYRDFQNGGVVCIDAGGNHDATAVTMDNFPVQSSIVVRGDGTGGDRVYFNTNAPGSAGYCYYFTGRTGGEIWKTRDDRYSLGGMACDNGYIVFGNDKNHVYIIKGEPGYY